MSHRKIPLSLRAQAGWHLSHALTRACVATENCEDKNWVLSTHEMKDLLILNVDRGCMKSPVFRFHKLKIHTYYDI